jgi:hypothetical protein
VGAPQVVEAFEYMKISLACRESEQDSSVVQSVAFSQYRLHYPPLFTHLKYATHVGLNLLLVAINLDNHIHQQKLNNRLTKCT